MRITPMPSARKVVVASRRLLSTHSGSTGSAARRSASAKPPSRATPTVNTAMLVGELHAQACPALQHAEDDQGRAAGQQRRAEVVDAVRAPLHRLVELPDDEH